MPRAPAAHIARSRIVALRLARKGDVARSFRAVRIFSSDSQTLLTRFEGVPQSTRNQQEYRTRGVMNLSVYRREGEPGLCCAAWASTCSTASSSRSRARGGMARTGSDRRRSELRPSRRPEPPEADLESEAHVTRCGSTWR